MFFFSSRRRHTRLQGDWSSDVCSSDLTGREPDRTPVRPRAAGLARPRARRPRWRAVARRRSLAAPGRHVAAAAPAWRHWLHGLRPGLRDLAAARSGDRKSTRLNSSHLVISYAVFCLKKKNFYPFYFHIHSYPRDYWCFTPISLEMHLKM